VTSTDDVNGHVSGTTYLPSDPGHVTASHAGLFDQALSALSKEIFQHDLGPGRQRFGGEEALGVVEDFAFAVVISRGNVGAGRLFVEPPGRKAHRQCHIARFFEHHAVWDESGIDIACHAVGVVGKSHGGASNDEQVGNHSTSHEPLTQVCERSLKLGTAEETVVTHAASRSRAER
jgi:hypothetical protein